MTAKMRAFIFFLFKGEYKQTQNINILKWKYGKI
jgi:hypothetical protein